MQDAGRCSPVNGNNDHNKNFVNFGFTQEQVECVCEVSVSTLPYHPLCVLLFSIKNYFATNDHHFSIRYCNMPEISNVWVDFYGRCRHVISYNWTNRFWKQKQWSPSSAATIKNCTICWNIINSRRTIMLNCKTFGWKHTTLKRKNCVAGHSARSANTESDANFHCRTRFGMAKRPATVSK